MMIYATWQWRSWSINENEIADGLSMKTPRSIWLTAIRNATRAGHRAMTR